MLDKTHHARLLRAEKALRKNNTVQGNNFFSGGITADFDFMPENILAWSGVQPASSQVFIHQRMGLKFVLSGKGIVNLDGLLLPVSAGRMYFTFPFQIHSTQLECDPGEFRYISITFVEKRRNYSSFLALKNRLLTPDAQDVENILKIVNCVMNPDAPAENAVFALLEVLLNQRGKQRNAPAPKEREDLFGRICNYIRENFDDEISVKTLASEFNVTTETIRRQFRKAGASLTPKKMLVLLRHQLAIELLEHSSMSVAEIARRCGFSDIFAFSRAFKRIDGNSPTQHRKLLKL